MDDTAILALIRAALATFEANSEADDGDRRLASPGECIETIRGIADPANLAPGYTATRDGWLSPETCAAIIDAQPSHAPGYMGSPRHGR